MSGPIPTDEAEDLFAKSAPPPSGRYFDRMGEKNQSLRQSFNATTMFDFSHLDENVKRHLQRVYLLLLFT
jgi:hypothetical protein